MSKENRQEIEPQISYEEYGKVLNGLDLKNINLASCEVKSNRELLNQAMEQSAPLSIDINDSADFIVDGQETIVQHDYVLVSRYKSKNLILIKVSYTLTFLTKDDFTPEFFEVFQHMALPLYTWPYLREFVASMTGRMDIPKLQLPLRRAPQL